MMIPLIVRYIKRVLLQKISQYFRKPYGPFGRNVKVDLDLFSYATKSDLKEATVLDTSNVAAKSD